VVKWLEVLRLDVGEHVERRKLRKMLFHSGCHANVIWILVLCSLVQCLMTAENRVHGKRSIVEDVKKNETVAQNQKQTGVSVRENTSNDTEVSKNKSAVLPVNSIDRTKVSGNVTIINTGVAKLIDNSSEASQETVQPSRKIISTGAFVRAFYVFVGVGAIVVMYIVVRTVRLVNPLKYHIRNKIHLLSENGKYCAIKHVF
jgi:heme exporter protein D